MHSLKELRNLYTPVQPSVKRTESNVTYVEHLPHVQLRQYIYCYWELKTTTPLDESFTYRVVTDGCVDIFFEIDRPNESFVMGFCKKYTEFPIGTTFHYVGIRFLPTIFSQIYKIDAQSISNQSVDLNQIAPDVASFIGSQLSKATNSSMLKSLIDDHFMQTIDIASFDDDPRLYDTILIILKKFGVVNLDAMINTGISHRQLRRLFNYYIGATPKTFSQVVRFQNILKAKPSTQSLKRNKLFFDLGYYDQAHFIRAFKTFYGVTPSKAFGRE